MTNTQNIFWHLCFFSTLLCKKKQSTKHLLVTSLIARKSLSSLLELAQLVPLRDSQGSSAHFSDRLHEISLFILRCYLDVYANSLFPCSTRLWILCLWNPFLWPTIYSLNPSPFIKGGVVGFSKNGSNEEGGGGWECLSRNGEKVSWFTNFIKSL